MWSTVSSLAAHLQQLFAPSSDPAAVKADLDRLERLWRRIQARINEAEAREEADASARLHLTELRGVALDAEDVLDEWNYELLRAEAEGGGAVAHHKRKRGEAASPDPAVCLLADDAPLRARMAREVARIMRDFDGVTDWGSSIRLGKGDGARRLGRGNGPPSSSLVDEGSVFDVNDYKEIMIRYIFSDECAGRNLTVIPIVGMGLVGKTTLAQLIYNDPRVVQHFYPRGWDSVTRDCDLKSLMQGVTKSLTAGRCCCGQLDTIQRILQRCLDGKKFLLVLDNFGDGNLCSWGALKASISCGKQGSVVLVTTRNGEVAKVMQTVPALYLHQSMPEVLPALESSYQALSAHLKPCLLYCSLFPKGYLFNADQLARLWMAQGLIQPKNRKRPEDIGIEYFKTLLSRSFFRQSETNLAAYFMPNLICDLVYSISMNEHSRVDDIHNLPGKARHLSLVCKSTIQCESFYTYSGLRSFLVMPTFPCTSIMHLEIQDEMFLKLNRLRALDLSYTDIQTLPDSVGNLKHLRFLALNHTKIKRLPESIHKLYHLQTLELKWCPRLQELPRGISSLINLRHLDVDSDYLLVHIPFHIQKLTSLLKLPAFNLQKGNGICRIAELQDLTNLRELGISGLCNVTNLDDANKANMQNKIHLKILKLIWPSNDAVPNAEQFSDCDHQNLLNSVDEAVEEDQQNDHDLNNARGSVGDQYSSHEKSSSHAVDDKSERPIDIPDEQESNLSSIQLRDGINNMGIQNSVVSDAELSEEDLLESLRPFTNIEMLCIKSYGGRRFPDWIGAPSFSKLISMELIDCSCLVLPSLGQLPHLKLLSIDGASVELVGREFCGTSNAKAFPKLETLSFHNINKWKEWGDMKEGDFPNLNKLCLFNCPHLRRVPSLFSSLEVLEVERCMELTDIPNLPSLQVLHLCCCDGLTSLPTTLTSLCSLTIMYCKKLESLPPLPVLESRWIEDCELLPSVLPDT